VTETGVAEERQRMGRVAAVGGPVLGVLLVATMPMVGYPPAQTLRWAALALPVVLAASLAGWCLPWRRWSERALLLVPVGGFGCLALLGQASAGRAAVFAAYPALLFLFVGLTQRPWTSVVLLPLALPTQFLLYGGVSTQLAGRLPISVVVWLSTAEVVSRYRIRTRHAFDDMETVAHQDALTGLANRHGLTGRLRSLGPDDAVLLVDLDHFKRLNDAAGHTAGDQVLRDFGAVVRSVIRSGDEVIRYGGEEILLLLRATDVAGARRLDSRLRAEWAEIQPGVTYSGGIAVVGHNRLPALGRADEAMYAAKTQGRNCTLVHSLDAAPRPVTSGDA
jgi:diguanylate cyclase (GGDEF)-like protein